MLRMAVAALFATAFGVSAQETPKDQAPIRYAGFPGSRLHSSLHIEMQEAATELATFLKGKGLTAVRVGDFTVTPRQRTSSGPMIAQVFAEELAKAGIGLDPKADIRVEGEFEDVKDRDSGLLAVKIDVFLLDRDGRKIHSIMKGAFGEALVAHVFGVTVSLPPGKSFPDQGRAKVLEAALDKPACHIAGRAVSTSAESPYAVELLTGPLAGGQLVARTPAVTNGQAFVTVFQGEKLAFRAINRSTSDAVITATVDGLSVFNFSEVKDVRTGRPLYQHIVVPKGESVTLAGWHRTNNQSDPFVTAAYPTGLRRPVAKFGTVTVTFAKCWREGEPKPADEPPPIGDREAYRPNLIEDPPRTPPSAFGAIREAVSIRFWR